MKLQVAKSGLCRITGPEIVGRPVPDVAMLRRGAWVCWWSDLPLVVSGIVPECEEADKECYRLAMQRDIVLRGRLGEGPPDAVKGFRKAYQPRRYQMKAAWAAFRVGGLLLADAVGMGKTLSAWCLRQFILTKDKTARTVVLCPPGLRWQWATEIAAYSRGRVPVLVSDGLPDAREQVYEAFLSKKGATLIVNYEKLRFDSVSLSKCLNAARLVVCDEASRLKNRTTKTSQLVKKLASSATWRLALTATPMEIAPENMHSIMEWVDPLLPGPVYFFDHLYVDKIVGLWCYACKKQRVVSSRRLGGREPVRCSVCDSPLRFNRGRSWMKVTGYRNLEHLRYRYLSRMVRRTPEEVGEEMPEVVSAICWFDLTEKERQAYERAREGCRQKLRDNPAQPMVAVLDAKRACLSPALVDGEGTGQKAGLIADFLATEAAGEQALVFTDSKEWLLSELAPALKKAGVQHAVITGDVKGTRRDGLRGAFNTSKVRVLVMDAVAEYGLNLPCGLVVNADLPWNPAKLEQRVGRARRMSSGVRRVRVMNFLARDTIEERVLARLCRRRSFAEILVGAADMEPTGEPDAKEAGALL